MGRFSDALDIGTGTGTDYGGTGKRKKFSEMLEPAFTTKRTSERYRQQIEEKTRAVQAGASFSALREASTVQDPKVRMEIFAKHRGIGMDRYRFGEGGAIEYQDEQGAWQKEEPRAGLLRGMVAGVAGGAPEEAATLIGGALGGVPGAAGAAFVASEARNVYNKIRYNERQGVLTYTLKPTVDALVGGAAGMGAKGGVKAVRAGQRVGKGPVGKLIAPEVREGSINLRRAGETASRLEAEGITPTLTEATGSRTLRGVEAYQRGTAGKAGYLYEAADVTRGKQVKAAVGRKLEKVSDVSSTLEAGEQAISSVKDIEQHILSQARKVERAGVDKKTVVSRLYEKAFKEAGDTAINTKPVLAKIDEILDTASGTTKVNMRKLRRDLLMKTDDPNKQVLKTGMGEVDKYYKQTVNDLYRKLKNKGDAAAEEVGKVRRLLLDEIERVAPSYRVARTVTRGFYSRLERFQGSTLGKMVARNEGKPHKLAGELFGPNSSTKIVKEAAQVLPEKDIRALAKAALINKWNEAAKAGPARAGSKLSDIVSGDPDFMSKIRQAVPEEQYKALDTFFKDILPKTKQVMSTDVPKTEGLAVAKERLSWVGRVAMKFNLTPYGLSRNMQDFAMGKHSARIAEQILQPGGYKKVMQLKQVSDNTEKLAVGILGMIGVGTLGTQQRATGAKLVERRE